MRVVFAAVIWAAWAVAVSSGGPPAADALHKIFADYDEWQLREWPEAAMSRGDYRYADKLSDNSLAAIERRHAARLDFLNRVREIDRSALSDDDRLNADLFVWLLDEAITDHRFRTYLMPIGARDGIHQEIPQMAERVRFDRRSDFDNYLARLRLVPARVAATIDLLKRGVEAGLTPPRVSLADTPRQIDALVADHGLDALRSPLKPAAEVLSAEENAAFASQLDAALAAIRASLAEFATYLRSEYVPKCRAGIDAIDLPDGEAYYAHRLKVSTTTDLTAKEIHELGLREVARIRAEMLRTIDRTDFVQRVPETAGLDDDARLKRFIAYLRTDPRFYFQTEEELLTGYRDICKQIDAWMPRFFHKLPRLPYGVRKIPDFMAPTQTTAYYSQGDIRNGEPGYFYANCYALDQRPKYEMRSLAIHEAVPGHHHQIALAQELDLPEFRKELWVTAFGEGWALYSERLGLEVDFYANPYDDFGRLTYEMWRACRLVVDPGMHALGWTREQAIQFMRDNTALSELNITAEVDRYISWPGQATAYKIGELRIRALRDRAEQTLGDRFDLRAFHDVVLAAGCIPLDVLESRVNAWIDDNK
jgi:uncharacterized protein (DUF885 family)